MKREQKYVLCAMILAAVCAGSVSHLRATCVVASHRSNELRRVV